MDKQLQTITIYNQYVNEYVNKFMHFDLYNDTFDALLKLLPPNSNLLELGCGPGNVIKYFSGKRFDLTILGIDLAPEMLKRAKEINPETEFRLMDIRNIHEINRTYEAVVGAFCLPYLSFADLDSFFLNLKNLTQHNGLVYLSCMEGAADKSGFETTSFTGESEIYIYYHQRNNLETKFSANGFTIEKFYTKDYPEADGSVTTDLIYLARKTRIGKQ
jgi:cyclopropane fatty-acyl-phospholipid synthase-like methyltransferase